MKNSISPQKKEHSIRYALEHPDRPLKELAQELGIGYSTLQKWIQQARRDGVTGSARQLSAEQQEIARLKKENAHLREVNEIIKKAHVYFVNNPNR
jgi:transposase